MKTKNIVLWKPILFVVLLTTFLGSCRKDNFEEINGVCPVVETTDPENLETNVPVDQVISVSFNTEMDPRTITTESFVITSATTAKAVVAGTIAFSLNNNGIIFTPDSLLESNTTYSGRVKTTVKEKFGNALQADYVWTFSTGLIIAPMVVSTDPADADSNVVLNKTITATFNVPMDALTINANSFKVMEGINPVVGVVSYNGLTAGFEPVNPFGYSTVYTCTITVEATDANGVPISADYVWEFKTEPVTIPAIILTSPLDQEMNVNLDKLITANFSEVMDPATITTSTFILTEGLNVIPGVVTYNTLTATFNPDNLLSPNTQYTVRITTGASDLEGTSIANDSVWIFTTSIASVPVVISTDPLDLATDVEFDKVISATFSELMSVATINTTTFTLTDGANSIPGNVNYVGTTASFTPNTDLLASTTYTATITTGAENLAGNGLANDYVWTFTTDNVGVDLQSVARFGIIAGVGVSNQAGFSEIRNMDVGISPGVRSSIIGFPPAIIVNGAMYASDDVSPPNVAAMLIQAKQDLTDAYLFAEAAILPAPATVSGDLGGMTLAPGIYKSTSTLLIQSGSLTLDAQGNPNAVWIFQVASDFTTVGGAGGSILLSGGAQAKNIYWQIGSSATIGDFTSFKGNVLALTSITMNSGATAEGRMLARNGAVVLTSTNIISKP